MSSSQPLVVLLAGLSGSGKSTFAPYLAKEMSATVLDTDDLFDVPRAAIGAALGIGPKVVDTPQWKGEVHGRLLSLFLAMASTASTAEYPIIAVSPWTGFRKDPSLFDEAQSGLSANFQWVIAICPPEMRYQRICERGREMDATKIASGPMPEPELSTPKGAITVNLGGTLEAYPDIAHNIAVQLQAARDR